MYKGNKVDDIMHVGAYSTYLHCRIVLLFSFIAATPSLTLPRVSLLSRSDVVVKRLHTAKKTGKIYKQKSCSDEN